MRRGALVGILLVGLSGCARVEAIFKPHPPAPERAAPVPPPPTARPTPPLPPLTPQLSVEEERKLIEDAQRKIGETDRLLRQLERRPMKPEEREMFLTAQSFLDQARRALTAREYQRAATLAGKARALSDDLSVATNP